MKLSNLFFIVFIIVLFFIASCNKSESNEGDLEFKKICQNAGYEWMLMKPTQDGKFIKDVEECWGCMVQGIEHICDKEKFIEFIPQK